MNRNGKRDDVKADVTETEYRLNAKRMIAGVIASVKAGVCATIDADCWTHGLPFVLPTGISKVVIWDDLKPSGRGPNGWWYINITPFLQAAGDYGIGVDYDSIAPADLSCLDGEPYETFRVNTHKIK
jgi:hypothetical protein